MTVITLCLISPPPPGTSLSVIIDLNVTVAVVMSTSVALLYTMFGQIISVVYTDIVQLLFITTGLVSLHNHRPGKSS